MKAFGYQYVLCFFILFSAYTKKGNSFEQNKDVGMGKYERVSAGTVSRTARCRDGVMNDFLSWCRHLLLPFHDLTSLHPPSFDGKLFYHLQIIHIQTAQKRYRMLHTTAEGLLLSTLVSTECALYHFRRHHESTVKSAGRNIYNIRLCVNKTERIYQKDSS